MNYSASVRVAEALQRPSPFPEPSVASHLSGSPVVATDAGPASNLAFDLCPFPPIRSGVSVWPSPVLSEHTVCHGPRQAFQLLYALGYCTASPGLPDPLRMNIWAQTLVGTSLSPGAVTPPGDLLQRGILLQPPSTVHIHL